MMRHSGMLRTPIAVITGLVLLGLLTACLWQAESPEAGLSLSVSMSELQPSNTPATAFRKGSLLAASQLGATSTVTGSGLAAAGELTASDLQSLEFSDGVFTAYILADSFLSLSPNQLNSYFEELYQAQSVAQSELESRYPSSRLLTRPVNFELGSTGTVAAAGLTGGRNYLIAVFAIGCDGDIADSGDGNFECTGATYEAMDFRRVALTAGQTTQVSLRLDNKDEQFEQFLWNQYGFYDPGDPAPGEIGYFEVYSLFQTLDYDNPPNYNNHETNAVVWEYRGWDGSHHGYHLYVFTAGDYAYEQVAPYGSNGPAMGRLKPLLPAEARTPYFHALIKSDNPSYPSPGEYLGEEDPLPFFYVPFGRIWWPDLTGLTAEVQFDSYSINLQSVPGDPSELTGINGTIDTPGVLSIQNP